MEPLDIDAPLEQFRALKNSIIGNPTAKLRLATEFSVSLILHYINVTEGGDPLILEKTRIEAAHVVSSLCYGSPEVLETLLAAQAHRVLLHAISHLTGSEPIALKSALVRAYKSIAAGTADVVGPSLFGLGPMLTNVEKWNEYRSALEEMFELESLDVFLPLLSDPSSQVVTSIATLLGSSLRIPDHRKAVIDWLSPSERAKESKGKRGWERPDVSRSRANAVVKEGGWAAVRLLNALKSSDTKLQESALFGLAALAVENTTLSSALLHATSEAESSRQTASTSQNHVSTVLNLASSRTTSVRVAACTFLVQILRSRHRANSPTLHAVFARLSQTVVNTLNNIIRDSEQSMYLRMRACFILSSLVTDEKELQKIAFECGVVVRLTEVLHTVIPPEEEEWPEDEADVICRFREGILTALASATLHTELIRRTLLTSSPSILPDVIRLLSHQDPGIRFAACHCARAFSKSVYVLRTSIGDTDIALRVLQMFESDPDDRVRNAALMVVANLVHDFSPTRATLMEAGVIPKLAQVAKTGQEAVKLNALWAIRNALYRCNAAEKKLISEELGRDEFLRLLDDTSWSIKEQAAAAVGNLSASSLHDVDLIMENLEEDDLVQVLRQLAESKDEDAAKHARIALANMETNLSSITEE